MKKPSAHRVVVMGHLIRTGALKRGNVSFLSLMSRGEMGNGRTLESKIKQARWAFPRFKDEIGALAGFPGWKRGFRNFDDDVADHVSLGIGGNASRGTLAELVTETEMGEGIQWRFTEKSMRAPLLWHAFLVCGNPSTLPLLEEIGLGDSGFAGDYDAVRDPQERLAAVLDRFDDFLSGALRPDEDYLSRNRDVHARFLGKAEESAARSMDALARILLDEM